jgi:hypothetical protein
MGRACGMYGERRSADKFLVGKPKGKSRLGIPILDGRIILSGFSRTMLGVVDWINLAQDRDNRRLL